MPEDVPGEDRSRRRIYGPTPTADSVRGAQAAEKAPPESDDEIDWDTLAISAIMKFGRDGKPPVPKPYLQYAARLNRDLVVAAISLGDFELGGNPETGRLSEVSNAIKQIRIEAQGTAPGSSGTRKG